MVLGIGLYPRVVGFRKVMRMVGPTAISVEDLYFSYGKHDVLRGVSFNVPKGSIAALIGPNGVGKTTTLFIIMGLLKPKKGRVKVFDKDINDDNLSMNKRIGFVYENPSFYRHLTMLQNLVLMGRLYGLDEPEIRRRINYLVNRLSLDKYINSKPNTLSHGYRERFAIAEALIPNPDLLILDEPTTGIDPETLVILHRFLNEINSIHETTILISSHNLYLLEKTAKYFIFMRDGGIVAEGWRERLVSRHGGGGNQYIIGVDRVPSGFRELIEDRFGGVEWLTVNEFILDIDPDKLDVLIRLFHSEGITIKYIRKKEPDLEDLYLKLCKGSG